MNTLHVRMVGKNNLNMDLTNKCTNLQGLRQLQEIRFCSMLLITKSSQVIVSAKKIKYWLSMI